MGPKRTPRKPERQRVSARTDKDPVVCLGGRVPRRPSKAKRDRIGLHAGLNILSRLVIVDSHELARAGLRSMLANEPYLEVVGEAADGRQALELCRRLRPALVLTDLRLPEMDGLAATNAIKRELPETRVVIVTMYENEEYVLQAFLAGAAGYVLKGATRREVLETVRRVLGGEVLQPELASGWSADPKRREEWIESAHGVSNTPRTEPLVTSTWGHSVQGVCVAHCISGDTGV
jgi:DNA-binding NarL/FixJ family response regulator